MENEKLYQLLLDISSAFDILRILRLIVNGVIKFTNSQRAVIMILNKKVFLNLEAWRFVRLPGHFLKEP